VPTAVKILKFFLHIGKEEQKRVSRRAFIGPHAQLENLVSRFRGAQILGRHMKALRDTFANAVPTKPLATSSRRITSGFELPGRGKQ